MPTEDDPMVWALAQIIAMREGREPDADHYEAALDFITQMHGKGYHFRPLAAHG